MCSTVVQCILFMVKHCVCIILHFGRIILLRVLNRFKAAVITISVLVFRVCKIGQHDGNIGFFEFSQILYSLA